jgi:hypothetical protein
VFVVINGSLRSSGEVYLENGPENFSRGRTDKFTLSLQDLGVIDRVVVGHSGAGSCPRWHLDKVRCHRRGERAAQVVLTCWVRRTLMLTLAGRLYHQSSMLHCHNSWRSQALLQL